MICFDFILRPCLLPVPVNLPTVLWLCSSALCFAFTLWFITTSRWFGTVCSVCCSLLLSYYFFLLLTQKKNPCNILKTVRSSLSYSEYIREVFNFNLSHVSNIRIRKRSSLTLPVPLFHRFIPTGDMFLTGFTWSNTFLMCVNINSSRKFSECDRSFLNIHRELDICVKSAFGVYLLIAYLILYLEYTSL